MTGKFLQKNYVSIILKRAWYVWDKWKTFFPKHLVANNIFWDALDKKISKISDISLILKKSLRKVKHILPKHIVASLNPLDAEEHLKKLQIVDFERKKPWYSILDKRSTFFQNIYLEQYSLRCFKQENFDKKDTDNQFLKRAWKS